MKNRSTHGLSALLLTAVFVGGSIASAAHAATLNNIFDAAEQINKQARQSQAKVDALVDQTRDLLNEYKTVVKETEGLRVYNQQLDKQIANQESEMAKTSAAIDKVTVIERQITPLMLRMIDGLDQFVALDLPFLLKERKARVENLREIVDRADVTPSEKFNQILRAYQIENEYGRTMESYTDEIETENGKVVADVLKVGRIALVYQTSDGEQTGVWNASKRAWEPLPDTYTNYIKNGIRMARKQLSVDMLTLPVAGPENAQ
jgi:regulator of replication initiation timing